MNRISELRNNLLTAKENNTNQSKFNIFNLGLIYRKSNIFWDVEYIINSLKEFEYMNLIIIEVTKFEKELLPNNLDGVVSTSFELDGIIEYVLEKNRNLKWIHNMWSGVEKHLSFKNIKDKDNITLTNGRGAYKKSLAEFAIAAIMYFTYGVNKQEKNIININRESQSLHGKTLTIVGYGWNGIEAAKKAKLAFNMKVIAIKKNLDEIDGKEFIDEIYSLDSIKEILQRSDFILNYLPSTPDTKDIFDNKLFNCFKTTAVFINLGRGSTVNEDDLIKVLRESRIAGAALDTTKVEPLKPNSEFYTLDNILLTHHTTHQTENYYQHCVEVLLNNISHYRKFGKYLTIVDKQKGY